jgi:hypothetical protein
MEHATVNNLIEGHARFCRGCGHDLVGLSGCTCPRCGRVSHPNDWRRRPAGHGAAGKWVVATLLFGGLILAMVALKFRRPPARRGPTAPVVEQVHRAGAAATAPVTRPVLAPQNDY